MSDTPKSDALIRDLVHEAPLQPLGYYVEGLNNLALTMGITYDKANEIILSMRNTRKIL